MSHTFFNLIFGDEVHIGSGKKIIPSKDFSTLLDARGIIDRLKIEEVQYRKDAAKEIEKLKEQAQHVGFEEGFREWTKSLAALEDEIRKTHSRIEKIAIPLALKAAKKIVGKEIELSDEVVIDIVKNSLRSVAQHKKIVIYVNKAEYHIFETHKDRIKEVFEHLESLSIRERDDIKPGGCVIETEAGIINAQLENKWQALEQAFSALLQSQTQDKI